MIAVCELHLDFISCWVKKNDFQWREGREMGREGEKVR